MGAQLCIGHETSAEHGEGGLVGRLADVKLGIKHYVGRSLGYHWCGALGWRSAARSLGEKGEELQPVVPCSVGLARQNFPMNSSPLTCEKFFMALGTCGAPAAIDLSTHLLIIYYLY